MEQNEIMASGIRDAYPWIVGQMVAVKRHGNVVCVSEIRKINRCHVICSNGQRFYRRSGNSVPFDSQTFVKISPATESDIAVAHRAFLLRKMQDVEFLKLNTDTLERIYAVVSKEESQRHRR